MSNITNTKLYHYLDRFQEQSPITADVFITNYCNLQCPVCTYGRWDLDTKKTHMEIEDFKKNARRLIELGVKGIILTGGGEPTIHPQFEDIAKWLESNNIHYGINTNGSVFRRCKPDYIKISLDGYDRGSYKELKGTDKYDEVIENIRKYCDWKKHNATKTTIGIQKIVSDESEIIKFYEEHKSLDFDYMVFRPIESIEGLYYTGKSEEINRCIKTIESIDDERVVANYKWEKTNKTFVKCSSNWAQIAVDENGKVIYCCHKPYEIVGDLHDEDILEKKRRYKTNMSMCDVPCRLTAPNEAIEIMKNEKNIEFI